MPKSRRVANNEREWLLANDRVNIASTVICGVIVAIAAVFGPLAPHSARPNQDVFIALFLVSSLCEVYCVVRFCVYRRRLRRYRP